MFSFAFFPGEKRLRGQNCGRGFGAKTSHSVWFSRVQPCLLKAAVLQPWHKVSALSQVLCLKGSRIIPFRVVPVSAVT